MIPEHTNDAVGQVHSKTGKHPTHLGAQRRERIQNKCVRGLLPEFGGARHDSSGWTITDLAKIRLGWRVVVGTTEQGNFAGWRVDCASQTS